MQDCVNHPGTCSASLWNIFKWLNEFISSRSFYNKCMVRVSIPGSWGTLTFMSWLLPYKVAILEETLGQLSIRRRTVDNDHRPSPAWHLALERARALKVFLETQATKSIRPEQAKTEEIVCAGLEPWFHIQGSHLSFVCQSLKLKSRYPAATNRHQFSGLKTFR